MLAITPREDIGQTTWYVCYTAVRAEEKAAAELRRRGFETFLPLCRRVIYVRGRKSGGVRRRVEQLRPACPRYLFVGVPAWLSLYAMRDAIGIEAVLYSGNVPAVVPTRAVHDFMAAQDMGYFDEGWPEERPLFEVGEHVRIAEGPMVDVAAVVVSCGSRKVEVLVEIFGREAPAHIPLDRLKRVG